VTEPPFQLEMPLIDPVTMSSAAMASRPAASTKANDVIDLPTPTNPTTLAHQATYLIPALQLAFFVARFNALVADPVNTMIMSLPVVSTLQAAYVTLCLPPAGSRGAPKPPKKVNRADRKKPVAKDVTLPPSPLTVRASVPSTGYVTQLIEPHNRQAISPSS
jgi:GPI ethanolamine phosphate transferase 2/3 subunit F